MSAKQNSTEKLQELILFVANRSEEDPKFGSIKLNKLLFFADFLAYVKLGKSITGQTYMRLDNGPVPRVMLPTLKSMQQDGTIAIKERDHYGKTQKVHVALREANLKGFSSEEIAIVTEVLDAMRSKNAKGISLLSHKFDGWKLAKDKEDIPYEVALVQFTKPRKRDIAQVLDNRAELFALRKEVERDDDP